MFFHIEHTTEFLYSQPATESFSELRLRPRNSLRQSVSRHVTQVKPSVLVESYTDYFGNFVETVSIPFRHDRLVVTSSCDVFTNPFADSLSGLDLTISEARHLYAAHRRDLHDFLRPSSHISFAPTVRRLAGELLRSTYGFTPAVLALNHYIFKEFKYRPGVTDVSTPVEEVMEKREGVCQDFAHLMISLFRCAGIPARYVSGYIETDPIVPKEGSDGTESQLIGATASHAWVEIFAPNGYWVGLDPTNDILEGERHVQIGIGRDYFDLAPLKGVFKGANSQTLSVQVRVSRNEPAPATDANGLPVPQEKNTATLPS
ncbi:MAG TPA: transglutaminase family protein [Roseimicrobium sp.]|nr:transglutaminase family protein [Roseimicrobium sp.]